MRTRLAFSLLLALFALPASGGEDPPAPAGNLHLAALQGDLAALRAHVAAGADLDRRDPYGSTPLVVATTFGRTEAARVLVEAGADTGAANHEGSTPLHVAAFLCREGIVKLLLEAGAERRTRNTFSNTPFDSVVGSFEEARPVYEAYARALAPMGLELDLDRIRSARPEVAAMLRPDEADLRSISYAPIEGRDWPVSTPAAEGLEEGLVAELFFDAAALPKLYAVLLVKNDRLVAEGYFNGTTMDTVSRTASVTKSVTSALTGIALERGLLSSPDQKVVEFFPEVADVLADPRKKQITVRHFLQMRGGYPWEETDPALWEGLLTGRYVPLLAAIPLVADPGSRFNYSNLTSNWLGILLARRCGTPLRAFAQEALFTPIGATAGPWDVDADGHNNGCGNLHLNARDMAKFGRLYLRGGDWDGTQVVPRAWVEASLANYSEDAWVGKDPKDSVGRYFRDLGYGYQWWSARVGEHDVDFAWGHGGQLVVLLHDLDMVVVAKSHPWFLQHDDEAWEYELATLNLVGKFLFLLPPERE
jgi:CubicO group peptidase (beta-lactamase class C family)